MGKPSMLTVGTVLFLILFGVPPSGGFFEESKKRRLPKGGTPKPKAATSRRTPKIN